MIKIELKLDGLKISAEESKEFLVLVESIKKIKIFNINRFFIF